MTAPALLERTPEPRGLGVQRRLVELGRIRLGEKGTKGEPKKLSKFRLTSASRPMLEVAARLYGGTVRSWKGAPDEGMWELYTDTDALDVMVPPMLSAYSQFYEIWDAGGCTLRCDGHWESIAEKACDHGDHEGMKVTTRVSVILPKLPGLGVWRLETHGWNAASTLPSSLDLIGAAGKWIPAVIRLEQRSSRTRNDQGRVLVRRFVVPVLDLVGVSFADMLAMGQASDAYSIPAPIETKALPAQTGPSRPAASKRVARPELAPEPPLEDEAEAFSMPVDRPFPEEPPEVAGAPAVTETPVDLAATLQVAAAASDWPGPATKDHLAKLGGIFNGWDAGTVKAGLAAAFGREAIAHPTAAQANAIILVADSLGDRFRPLWEQLAGRDASA